MQPQTNTPQPGLLFDDPGELIAAIPVLLTFHPADSIVLVTYAGSRRLDLESVLRIDIPAFEHIDDVVAQLRVVAVNHDAALVDLVVLGGPGADPPGRLPARELVDRLTAALGQDGITVSHAVWAPRVEHHETWWCYADPACTGRIRDPLGCGVTAELTAAGAVTFGSREELAALLTPDPADTLSRRAALIAAHPPGDTDEELRFIKSTLDTIAGRLRTHPRAPVPEFDDATIARLAAALSTPAIREACLALTMTIPTPAPEHLWTVLTRATPKSARAEPASLLGIATYLHGDGARAALALDAALTANPGHALAHTLRHVLDNGLPPRLFRALLANSFVAAFANL